ncbi:MAG: SPFH domain-containing protein [Alphaproteobacteria bacterium]|nr:SPFH domain-containing protein [Alphaproteobacteria bacterium]
MKTQTLSLSDPRLLAEFIRQEDFKAFFEKRFEVPPDHMGLLMRNGQFVDAFQGAHFTVGGLFNQLKGLIGGSSAVSLLLADLKTFQTWYDFNAITKDKVDIRGTVTLELQINPERPQNIIGMMAARKSLSKDDVSARLRPHLADRVYEAAVSRVGADEVRGNKGLQDMIQADVMKEVERVAGDLGLLIRSVSVEWAVNEVEKKEIQRASALREAEAIEFEFETLKRSMEREHESTEIRISSKLDVDKMNLQSEADLERLVLDQEITFLDARETSKRVQEMKILQHEIDMLKSERLAKFDGELQSAIHQGVDLKVIDERRRVVERGTGELDMEHRLRLRALERDYDAETRGLVRGELTQNRREDRDYDHDTRDRNLDIQGKERDFGFEGRKKEVDVKEKEQLSALEIQVRNDKAALDKLKGLAGLENDTERERLERRIKEGEVKHKQTMDTQRLDAQREVDRMQLGAKMTPEQILAINAGLSPAVANILVEQAKAGGANSAQSMQLMREMVEQANRAKVQSEEQARAMFNTGMQGAVGVAAGAGAGGMAGMGMGIGMDPNAIVECPKCGRPNAAKARFCVGCGDQLRQ